MTKLSLQFFVPFLLTVCISSCNGQHKQDTNNIKTKNVQLDRKPRTSKKLIQDCKGNIWSCGTTKNGVSFYDGKTFKTYLEKDGLSSNSVNSILEDSEGTIWLATDNGVTIFHNNSFEIIPMKTITGQNNPAIIQYENNYGLSLNRENVINCLMEDSKGVIWFGTSTGIYRKNGNNYTHFTHNDGVVNNTGEPINEDPSGMLSIEGIFEDTNGNVWFGGRGNKGVFCYDGKMLANLKPDNDNWLVPLMQDKSGTIWFAKRAAALYRYDGQNFITFGRGEFNDFFFLAAQDSSGNYWFGNNIKGGITYYDGTNFKNYKISNEPENEMIWGLLVDKENKIWLSGKKNNLYKFEGKTVIAVSE